MSTPPSAAQGWSLVARANGQDECVPECSGGCGEGRCSAPATCTCTQGWAGPRCEVKEACPPGRWGASCDQHCSCANG